MMMISATSKSRAKQSLKKTGMPCGVPVFYLQIFIIK
jgi:hypothetical protein